MREWAFRSVLNYVIFYYKRINAPTVTLRVYLHKQPNGLNPPSPWRHLCRDEGSQYFVNESPYIIFDFKLLRKYIFSYKNNFKNREGNLCLRNIESFPYLDFSYLKIEIGTKKGIRTRFTNS
jgi:hypothetical protein